MTNDSNIINLPKKQILENHNLEHLPPPQDEIITCFESLSISYSNDPSMWIMNDDLRDYFAVNGFEQNKNIDFFKSLHIPI